MVRYRLGEESGSVTSGRIADEAIKSLLLMCDYRVLLRAPPLGSGAISAASGEVDKPVRDEGSDGRSGSTIYQYVALIMGQISKKL